MQDLWFIRHVRMATDVSYKGVCGLRSAVVGLDELG